VLAAEQLLHFGRTDGLANLDQCGFDLAGRLGVARLGHFKEDESIGERLVLLFPIADCLLQRSAFFEDGLGFLLGVPKFIGGDAFFERGSAGLFSGDVKDASRDCLPGFGVRSVFP
jgi:hypothetical protein